MEHAPDYEKLGAFYLGREVDRASGQTSTAPLLYDAKDLTTHAVIVGMTGSGKTGLGIGILEEAAIDGVPAIIIDPKGDMGNLALTFPRLLPEDFEPWIDEGAAKRAGRTLAEHAKGTAQMWETGLADWDQPKERISRLQKAAEVRIWTPGSTAGHGLTMLKSFDAPPRAVLDDAEALGDRVQATTAGLLALVGIDPDPVKSREAILVANILQEAWGRGRSLGIGELIGAIQQPPFDKLGVLDLETFYPRGDRSTLAMRLNGLLASPGFAAWLQGEPLEIQRLLYAPDGRPRLSVLSISHLSDDERMSFVTVLLGELLSWIRTQPGTSSLRALLYMDEIFGFFPPTANPPSKKPMLTLLKQARAFGVGVVLSTQNPVDLDYKGLSNCGTWFLGRLQTERDKLRVLDGLQGALDGASGFGRSELEKILSGMQKRTFLLHNVHEGRPALFQTRWVLSYLRGPMTRPEIERVTAADKADPVSETVVRGERLEEARARETAAAEAARATARSLVTVQPPPELPAEVIQSHLAPDEEPGESDTVLYRPSLYVVAKAHYVSASAGIDLWRTFYASCPVTGNLPGVDWERSRVEEEEILPSKPTKRGLRGASYASVPSTASRVTTWRKWHKDLEQHIHRTEAIVVWRHRATKFVSETGETEAAFRARVRQASVEARDLEVEKVRKKYEPRFDRAEEKIRKAHEALGLQEEQLEAASSTSWLEGATSLFGSIFGRKRVTTGVKAFGQKRVRVAREKQDVERAERELKAAQDAKAELERELQATLDAIEPVPAAPSLELEEVVVRPRKSDFDLSPITVVWTPEVVAAG